MLATAGSLTGAEPQNSAVGEGMVAKTYDVRGLIVGGDADTCREILTSVIAPETWQDVGGEASISFLGTKMALRQTPAAHKNVGVLLAALRKLPQVNSRAARARPEEPQIVVGTQNVGKTEMQIALYPIGDLLGPRVDFDSIIEHVTKMVAPRSWMEVGGSASIEVYPYRAALIVSNTPQAHKEIVRVLAKMP
jgi:hypothetical protein